MPYIIRTALPRVRVQVPGQVRQAVPAVYLGMPPLPLAYVNPLNPLPKEAKAHAVTANIRGVSVGSVTTGTQSQGTKNGGVRRKATTGRAPGRRGKTKKSANAQSVPSAKKSKGKKANHLGLKRGPGGKFLKKKR